MRRRRLGPVEVVVNNAADWAADTFVPSGGELDNRLVELCSARWGRIIHVSTAGAERFPSEISYGASKYALESYTRSAAMELGKLGITVHVVSLGPVQTG